MSEYNITFFEACEILNRSKKTLSRYIRRGVLNPHKVKSQQGTLEYRFTRAELDALRERLATMDRPDETRQDTPDKTGHPETTPLEADPTTILAQTGQSRQDRQDKAGQDKTAQEGGIIGILKETTELLKGQLAIKDTQIGTLNEQVHKLIERDRETNILLKGLQDKLMLLEPPKPGAIDITGKTGRDGTGKRGQRIRQVILSALLLITLGVFFYYNLLPAIRGLYGK